MSTKTSPKADPTTRTSSKLRLDKEAIKVLPVRSSIKSGLRPCPSTYHTCPGTMAY